MYGEAYALAKKIRQRAYVLWAEQGFREDRVLACWRQAEQEVRRTWKKRR